MGGDCVGVHTWTGRGLGQLSGGTGAGERKRGRDTWVGHCGAATTFQRILHAPSLPLRNMSTIVNGDSRSGCGESGSSTGSGRGIGQT